LEPQSYFGYLNRGDVYYERGEDAQAIADYTQVLELLGRLWDADAGDIAVRAQALGSRGALYARQGRLQEALVDLGLALGLYPEDADLFNSRGLTYLAMGNYERAIADFSAAIALAPREGMYYQRRAEAYAKAGEGDLALADQETAISLGIMK
jgi:tetratricopeptide (TPR) repeat protein